MMTFFQVSPFSGQNANNANSLVDPAFPVRIRWEVKTPVPLEKHELREIMEDGLYPSMLFYACE